MDSYDFTTSLIESNTILDYETYTENAIKAILANDLTQDKFIDMLNDFKSFEGDNHKFCINFTGAWLKYALNGIHNKSKMNSDKLIIQILGDNFTEKERVPGTRHPQLSSKNYEKINWKDILGDSIIEDKSPQRKYMLMECSKQQKSNNAWHKVNMILVRPKDLLDILTTSKCVAEYRKYFITLAEIRRSYQETYLGWVIEQYKTSKLTLEQKLDRQSKKMEEQSNQINQLLIYGKDSNDQIHYLRDEVSILNIKIDNLFDYLLSFARMTIPTWIGSTVIKQQYDTLAHNKDRNYALKHLKVLFMVGFYVKFPRGKFKTKSIDGQDVRVKTFGNIKMYACCTNFADIGPRIKLLYRKYTDGDNIMFMLKPTIITLISCEVNLERIVLENSTNIFPDNSVVEWDSKFKCYNISIGTSKYRKAHAIFNTICNNASVLRFQGYQQRVDKFNSVSSEVVDKKIIDYIDSIDEKFYSETKPFCQQYIDSYYYRSIDSDTNELVEYAYGAPTRKCSKRIDLNNENLTNCGYALRKLETLIDVHSSSDHIKFMADTGILTKENLPYLKAIAKFENIDTSGLEEPDELIDSGSESD